MKKNRNKKTGHKRAAIAPGLQIGPQLSSESIQERADRLKGTIEHFGTRNWNPQVILSGLRIAVDDADPFGAPISRRAGNRCQLLVQARPVCIRPSQSVSAAAGGVVAATTLAPAWRDLMSRT